MPISSICHRVQKPFVKKLKSIYTNTLYSGTIISIMSLSYLDKMFAQCMLINNFVVVMVMLLHWNDNNINKYKCTNNKLNIFCIKNGMGCSTFSHFWFIESVYRIIAIVTKKRLVLVVLFLNKHDLSIVFCLLSDHLVSKILNSKGMPARFEPY